MFHEGSVKLFFVFIRKVCVNRTDPKKSKLFQFERYAPSAEVLFVAMLINFSPSRTADLVFWNA